MHEKGNKFLLPEYLLLNIPPYLHAIVSLFSPDEASSSPFQ